jgi:hypothetical protein
MRRIAHEIGAMRKHAAAGSVTGKAEQQGAGEQQQQRENGGEGKIAGHGFGTDGG